MSLRALIYIRVSTEDQVDKYGLPAQLRACREYAAANGYQVIEEIADEGISGMILDRAGLSRVRQMARDRAVDVVLMLDADRLSRELAHLLILKPEIEKTCQLLFVAAKFEDSASGRMFFGIRGVIAQYERELTRERTMRGKRERAQSGRRVGGREPYGYRDADGLLVVDEERAAIARQIFQWYEAGVSLRASARRLRAMGAPTWGGGRWWSSAVRSMLTNEVYAGVSHWGPERIAFAVPALVERAQWERVQSRLAQNVTPGRPSTAYMLKGLLYCGCGLKMYGESTHSGARDGRRIHYYRCRSRDRMLRPEQPCAASVSASKLDAAAWRGLLRAFADGDALRSMLREHEAGLRPVEPGRADQLEAQVRKLRGREAAAMELLLDPDLASERASIKRQLAAARQERSRVEAEIAASGRVASIRPGSWVDETAALVREYLGSVETPEKRQEWARGVVARAEWNGEELEMRCLLGPESISSSPGSDRFPALEIRLTVRLAA